MSHSNSPITTPTLKTYLGLRSSATGRDARIDSIVKTVNAWILDKLGRRFSDGEPFVELQRGTGGPSIVLDHYPIVALTAIDEDGTALDPTDSDIVSIWASKGIVTRTDGGVWLASLKPLYTFTYTGEVAVPDSVAGAALEIGAFLFKGGGHVKSQRQVGVTTQMVEQALGELPGAREAIAMHTDTAKGQLQGVS